MYIYVIMKIMCPPGYHHSGFVTTDALRHMMPKCISYHKTTGVKTGRAHYFHDYIYITLISLQQGFS